MASIMLRRSPVSASLLHFADPLEPVSGSPRISLSSQQLRKLMLKADAHGVLPATLRHFPISAENLEMERVCVEANSRRIQALARSTMLAWHAESIVSADKALAATVVKGPVFAQRLYPPRLRSFADIDILAATEALPQLAAILHSQGFLRVEGLDPRRMEDIWVHHENEVLIVETHTDLVHSARNREAFSLTYDDIEGNADAPGTLLVIAIIHGCIHYFALLRHAVDICQAARALKTTAEESRFESLVDRAQMRLGAVVGLMLAWRLFGEVRCIEVARALGPIRAFRFARLLIEGSVLSAPMNSWIIYNSWRRFVFRELLRYGTLHSSAS